MAEYESMKDFRRFFDRIWNRINLIFYKNQLVKLKEIPNLNIKDKRVKNEDIFLFYSLSDEFIKYLVHHYGEDKHWYVVKIVGQEMNFDDSFMMVYNKEYSVAFSEFLEYFY